VSGAAHHRLMKKTGRVADVEALIREIQRYLAYVDAFRSIGRPTGRRSQEHEEKEE